MPLVLTPASLRKLCVCLCVHVCVRDTCVQADPACAPVLPQPRWQRLPLLSGSVGGVCPPLISAWRLRDEAAEKHAPGQLRPSCCWQLFSGLRALRRQPCSTNTRAPTAQKACPVAILSTLRVKAVWLRSRGQVGLPPLPLTCCFAYTQGCQLAQLTHAVGGIWVQGRGAVEGQDLHLVHIWCMGWRGSACPPAGSVCSWAQECVEHAGRTGHPAHGPDESRCRHCFCSLHLQVKRPPGALGT